MEVRTDGERYAHFTPEQLRAVAYSGAAGDELMSERIAEQQAQLEMLMKRRAGLASALSSKDD